MLLSHRPDSQLHAEMYCRKHTKEMFPSPHTLPQDFGMLIVEARVPKISANINCVTLLANRRADAQKYP